MDPLVSFQAPLRGMSLGPGTSSPSRNLSSRCRSLQSSSDSHTRMALTLRKAPERAAGRRTPRPNLLQCRGIPGATEHAHGATWQQRLQSSYGLRRDLALRECASRPAAPFPLQRHTAARRERTRAAHRAAQEAAREPVQEGPEEAAGRGAPGVEPKTQQDHVRHTHCQAQAESQGLSKSHRAGPHLAELFRVRAEPEVPAAGSRRLPQESDKLPLHPPGRRGAIFALALAAAAAGSGDYTSVSMTRLSLGSGAALAAEAAVESEARRGQGEAPGASVQTRILRSLGIGDPDVYYPRVFLGDWECESILLSVDTPQGVEVADIRAADEARRRIGMPVVYQARFVEFGGNVISERLLTTKSLVEETVGKGVLVDADWNPSRANVLTLTLKGGIKVRNLITKRSFDLSAPGQFDVSEYSKQVLDNQVSVEGPPSVKASGNLTRFRWDPDAAQVDQIEAFQRVAMFPVVGGQASGRGEGGLTAMDVASLGFGEKPTTVYKYLLHLRRVK